ncbi:MAG: efflux transporter outer membrane subunit [Pedobacter sp.]|nr:MAG: efflux transporter outer membrane subunit [Pedobacter sp.]
MFNKNKFRILGFLLLSLIYSSCKIPALVQKNENPKVPAAYAGNNDTTNIGKIKWVDFFKDQYLTSLIDTALQNNQELNITLQEIEIARNEVRVRKGELMPNVGLKAGAGLEKVGRYTSQGAGDASTEIKPGKEMPEPLPDYLVGLYAKWEVDIWHKLRDSKKAAYTRYLSSVEGKNFVITSLVAELANSYYELLALDNQLDIVRKNIDLQTNALEIVRIQKQATRVTELAVRKFEAEVLNSKSLEFEILQKTTETENKINFLLGRYPQHIMRDKSGFNGSLIYQLQAGIPSQLLANRPDIKQAELDLIASKLDVRVAKAQFYPSFGISAGLGFQAFNPKFLIKTPESMLYSIAGDMVAPLINRNAIKANYLTANAKQIQAVYQYERSILNAYLEVANQLSGITNLEKSYDLKSKQVQALSQSIEISNDLFKSTRADYLEVLMTQRDALEAKLDLIETRKQQLNATVKIYQALGGGWN